MCAPSFPAFSSRTHVSSTTASRAVAQTVPYRQIRASENVVRSVVGRQLVMLVVALV